jgi:hypothetical protein
VQQEAFESPEIVKGSGAVLMPQSFWEGLAAVAEARLGLRRLPWQAVQVWFEMKWPQYRARGYSKHERAIASWWARAWDNEVGEAVETWDRMEIERRAQVMRDRLADRPCADTPDAVPSGALPVIEINPDTDDEGVEL